MPNWIYWIFLQKSKYEPSDQVLNIFHNFDPPYWIRHCEFWKSNIIIGFSDPKNLSTANLSGVGTFLMINVRRIGSAILNFEKKYQKWIQRTQKSNYHQFYQDPNIFGNFGPPFWIRPCEFWKSNKKIGFSDSKNPTVTTFIKVRKFLITFVRHIGSVILNFENPISDLDSANSKTLTYSQIHKESLLPLKTGIEVADLKITWRQRSITTSFSP